MMDHILEIADFLETRHSRVLLDVRSPGEYEKGHIPGALSFPLFSDVERAEIGTLYKQKGRDVAMLRGLKIVGPKLADFVDSIKRMSPEKKLAVHCWRGGQRSQSMAWLFRQSGFDVCTLKGGYKSFRRHVLKTFERRQLQLIVVGGQTGTGKTRILHALQQLGEQIIDLEALAHHKGSAFGHIGESEQPTVEQFENELFEKIIALEQGHRVWIENESQSIGRIFIPLDLWRQMKKAPLINIEIPKQDRIQNLVRDYANISTDALESAFRRIEKKLGGQHLKSALEALRAGDTAAAADTALTYYDKTYRYCLENNTAPEIRMLKFETGDPEKIARACLQLVNDQSWSPANPVPLEASKIGS